MSIDEWDQGSVKFIITDFKGNETRQEQMCWNRRRFIARQMADAEKSQQEKNITRRFLFRLA